MKGGNGSGIIAVVVQEANHLIAIPQFYVRIFHACVPGLQHRQYCLEVKLGGIFGIFVMVDIVVFRVFYVFNFHKGLQTLGLYEVVNSFCIAVKISQFIKNTIVPAAVFVLYQQCLRGIIDEVFCLLVIDFIVKKTHPVHHVFVRKFYPVIGIEWGFHHAEKGHVRLVPDDRLRKKTKIISLRIAPGTRLSYGRGQKCDSQKCFFHGVIFIKYINN